MITMERLKKKKKKKKSGFEVIMILFFFSFSCSFRSWRTALQSTSPLIILGFARLVSTAGVDYQVEIFYSYCL
jgi:hypothetical protein